LEGYGYRLRTWLTDLHHKGGFMIKKIKQWIKARLEELGIIKEVKLY
jgi:hypothetical protein